MLLNNKVAIITGAASKNGIGKAIAKSFSEQGARVAILDLDGDASDMAAKDISDIEKEIFNKGYQCDVTDHVACNRVIAQVIKDFGQIDILVNNAGITQPKKIMDISVDDYHKVTDVNLRGTFNISQSVIPTMIDKKAGSIICLSSISAEQGGGIFGGPHYCAAKAGVIGLMRAMAKELGVHGIRVNAVAPGMINTDISQGKITEKQKQSIAENVPLGRVGKTSDVAGPCIFLASELSSYVNGIVLDINGGSYMK